MKEPIDFRSLAIEMAEKSIPEDARIHPRVGAVLEKNGTLMETAFRGEISLGDHAEYTLLERKLLSHDVTGTTLYTTLEPCIEAESSLMKCTERIIRRRVKRVVIGMLDPNPRIRGEGVMVLRDHGVEVELFPPDLMKKVEQQNTDFMRRYRSAQENDLNELRRQGNRIQVIASIVTRKPQHSILLGRSAFGEIWMPPQEGVNLTEKIKDALFRGLQEECGLKGNSLLQNLYIRSIKYLGALPLPEKRINERSVADDAIGTEFEVVQMRSKAYWQAIIVVASQEEIRPSPNNKEILELKWHTFDEAKSAIEKTNSSAKAKLLLAGLAECEQALQGVISHTHD